MNYCYNCGAKLVERNQKFCISCGASLTEREEKGKDFVKSSRKKYTKMEGESYLDYLERINSPMKGSIASDEEIEEESKAYIDYDPLEDYNRNHPKINYPEHDYSYDDEDDEDDEDEYQKEVIVDGMFGAPKVSTQGNYIVEGMYGRPKYYVDGDIIREGNQFGKPVYHIDGNYVREGMYGKPKYYIDGDLIRENNQFGRVVGRKRKV